MTTLKRRRKRYLDRDVEEKLAALILRGYSAKQIETELSTDEKYAGRLPQLRTLQRIVSEPNGLRDAAATWSINDTPADDLRLVLDVWAAVLVESDGRVHRLTVEEAQSILRVRKAAPWLEGWPVWLVAREYLTRVASNEDTTDLDLFLALVSPPSMNWDQSCRREQLRARIHADKWPTRALFASSTALGGWLVAQGWPEQMVKESPMKFETQEDPAIEMEFYPDQAGAPDGEQGGRGT